MTKQAGSLEHLRGCANASSPPRRLILFSHHLSSSWVCYSARYLFLHPSFNLLGAGSSETQELALRTFALVLLRSRLLFAQPAWNCFAILPSFSLFFGYSPTMKLSLLAQAAVAALASASTLTPPVLPLIVRNPYLSTWVRSRDAPWEKWPIFWTGNSVSFGF